MKEVNKKIETNRIQKKIDSLNHLLNNLEYFVRILTLLKTIIVDRYREEKEVKLNSEILSYYDNVLLEIEKFTEYMRKQEPAYQLLFKKLERKLK